jgi:hypothetical protein
MYKILEASRRTDDKVVALTKGAKLRIDVHATDADD